MGDFQTYVQQNFTYSVILLFIGAFFGFGFDAIKLAYHQKKLRKAFCILFSKKPAFDSKTLADWLKCKIDPS